MENQILQFRQKFIDDASLLVDNLERDLMLLENDPQNKELIESVFRCMHTLKGTSSMFGFENIADITHHLENIYDLVRNNTLAVSTHLIHITLITADYVKTLFTDNNIITEKSEKINQNIISSINQILHNTNIKEIKKISKKKDAPIDGNFHTWQITFIPDESIIARCINLAYTMYDLFALGSYQIVQNEITDERSKFTIFLYTDKTFMDIEDALIFVLDNCKITKIANYDIFDENALEQHKIIEAKTESIDIEIIPEEIKVNSTIEIENDIFNITTTAKSRLNVEATKLDELMFLVSELITANSQLALAAKNPIYKPLRTLFEKIDDLSKLFRSNTINLRLVPINEMIIRFQRLVRDLSKQLGKEVELVTQGTETELDKSTIDALSEPLMHIIRNCIDHGIEQPEIREEKNKTRKGTIKITAFYSGNFVFIQVQDDGRGIDPEFIRAKAIEKGFISTNTQLSQKEIYDLIFKPGFSTAETLTQISGRGVGMDVVKNKISELRGQVEISSEIGLGTSFTLKLHQTIAILDTMLFQIDDLFFMVPLSDVEECRLIENKELEHRKYSKTVVFNNQLIPYIDLYKLLKLQITEKSKKQKLLIINRQENYFAFAADEIIGEHQAVLKTIGEASKKQPYIAVASVLGDGNLAYLLDMNAVQNLLISN